MTKADAPKVTMIIISYNEKEYLPRAIDSCLKQTYANKEIIIGDDGSNDGSIELIQTYEEQGLRYFVMERNEERASIIPSLRVSNVIKRAMDLTDGDYYVILSGDDYYIYDQMLTNAVEYLEGHPNYFSYVYGFQKVTDEETLEVVRLPKCSPAVYYASAYNHVSCFVFRRLGSEELLDRFCDDTGLEFVLATKGKWKWDDAIALAYYQRDASIMHKADKTELSVVEMMLFQDILNWKGRKSRQIMNAVYSRYYRPYRYLSEHLEYRDEKYQKYLKNAAKYPNNLFEQIPGKKGILLKMGICHLGGRVARKLRL